jgi:hypothetical protein
MSTAGQQGVQHTTRRSPGGQQESTRVNHPGGNKEVNKEVTRGQPESTRRFNQEVNTGGKQRVPKQPEVNKEGHRR